jgi:hypothetical protein
MNLQQHEKLLFLYKKAVANNLLAIDFANAMREAEIQLDSSFVKDGKEDMNLGVYLEELKTLKKNYSNE